MHENLPASRKEAKLRNLKHYFTGKPCNRGHIERRRTKDGWCLMCNYENSTEFRNSQRGKEYFGSYEKSKEIVILSNAKQRAKKLKVPFDLTLDDIIIPSHCPVFGIEIKNNEIYKSNHSPSIDRLVPEKGYVKNNICIISDKANRLKSNMTIEDVKKLLHYMEKHINANNLC